MNLKENTQNWDYNLLNLNLFEEELIWHQSNAVMIIYRQWQRDSVYFFVHSLWPLTCILWLLFILEKEITGNTHVQWKVQGNSSYSSFGFCSVLPWWEEQKHFCFPFSIYGRDVGLLLCVTCDSENACTLRCLQGPRLNSDISAFKVSSI